MAWQLVYTSAPRLLDAGRSGFGTVARHRDIPPLVVQAVERFSQFARLPGMSAERVIYSHRIIQVSSARYHVLSVIRSAGSDYTGRTNHIAHHLIATDREASASAARGLTPADVLVNYAWLTGWNEPPRTLSSTEEVGLASVPVYPLEYSAWAPLAGDPAYAWLLVNHPAGRGCYVKAPADTDFRFLFLESLRGMGSSSWQPTFTTSLEPTDDAGDFRWIGLEESVASTAVEESSGRVILDLTEPETLPEPEIPSQEIPQSAPAAQAKRQWPQGIPQLPSARPLAPGEEPDFEARVPSVAGRRSESGQPGRMPFPDESGGGEFGFKPVIFGLMAVVAVVMLMLGIQHKKEQDRLIEEKRAAEEVRQQSQKRKEGIKARLGADPFFTDVIVDDIAAYTVNGAPLSEGEVNAYCDELKSYVRSYHEAQWNVAFKPGVDVSNESSRVKTLREHTEKLEGIKDRKLQFDSKTTDGVAAWVELCSREIKDRTDECEDSVNRFLGAINGTARKAWEPSREKIASTIKHALGGQLREKLKGYAPSKESHLSFDSAKWKGQVTHASLDDLLDKGKICRLFKECVIKAVAAQEQRPPSERPAIREPQPPVGQPPSSKTVPAKPPAAEEEKKSLFYDKAPEVELPANLEPDKGSVITFRPLAGAAIKTLTYRRAWKNFGDGEDEKPWYEVDRDRGRTKLVPTETAIAFAAQLLASQSAFELSVMNLEDRFYVIGSSDGDQPILGLNFKPELTLGADHILNGKIFGQIKVQFDVFAYELRFKDKLGSDLDKVGISGLQVNGKTLQVIWEPLRKVLEAKSSTAELAAQREDELSQSIKRDEDRIAEIDRLKEQNTKDANNAELSKEKDLIVRHLPGKRENLSKLKSAHASQDDPGGTGKAALAIKTFFSQIPASSNPSPSEATAMLLLVKKSSEKQVRVPLCEVKIRLK